MTLVSNVVETYLKLSVQNAMMKVRWIIRLLSDGIK